MVTYAIWGITISIGVATSPGEGVASEDELLRQADDALYAAKNAGRDQVVCAPKRSEKQRAGKPDIA